jgi:MFS transporter, DHA2 family, metal-tetracycline-proton antiporter
VKKATLLKVAILPVFMLLCYIGLYFYFQSRGGYKVQHAHEGGH